MAKGISHVLQTSNTVKKEKGDRWTDRQTNEWTNGLRDYVSSRAAHRR